jgi:hypothetical protein
MYWYGCGILWAVKVENMIVCSTVTDYHNALMFVW